MTSYITITDAETDPEAPLTSELAKKWRDNPIAITEGDATAPKILGLAAARDSNGALPVLSPTASDAVILQQGHTPVTVTLTTNNTANPPTVVAQRYTIKSYNGTLRFKASHVNSAGGGNTSRLSLFKNNVLVQAFTTTSSLAARTVDVSVIPTDVLEWRHSISNSLDASIVSSVFVTASDGYVSSPLYIPFSQI